MSQRLTEVLSSVQLIAAEDTRVTKVLLAKLGISTPMVSVQKYNEAQRIDMILKVLESGQSVALVSDAGTPNIADPGAFVVAQVRMAGYRVSPVPGPSALTAFLSVSGVLSNQFFFAGFLPKKSSEIAQLLDSASVEVPFVFYETGLRLIKSLATLQGLRPVAKVVLGKELSKWYETIYSGSFDDVLAALSENSTKGEWVGMVVWASVPRSGLSDLVKQLKSFGLTPKQIVEVASKVLNYPKNAVYDEAHL